MADDDPICSYFFVMKYDPSVDTDTIRGVTYRFSPIENGCPEVSRKLQLPLDLQQLILSELLTLALKAQLKAHNALVFGLSSTEGEPLPLKCSHQRPHIRRITKSCRNKRKTCVVVAGMQKFSLVSHCSPNV